MVYNLVSECYWSPVFQTESEEVLLFRGTSRESQSTSSRIENSLKMVQNVEAGDINVFWGSKKQILQKIGCLCTSLHALFSKGLSRKYLGNGQLIFQQLLVNMSLKFRN